MARSLHRLLHVLCIALLLIAGLAPGSRADTAVLTVYGNALASGWQDWSWDTTRNFFSASTVYPGNTYSISVQITGAWGGLFLVTPQPIAASPYDSLVFYINGGTAGNQQLNVFLADNTREILGDGYPVQAVAGQWTKVSIPLTSLTSPSRIAGICLMDATGGAQPTYYLDNIYLANQGLPSPPTLTGPALSINVSASTQHPISEGIYGINFADETLATALNLPVCRWGGNSTTRYNWQTNMHNTGSDWYFENIPNGNNVTDGSASDLFVEQNILTGTKTLMTVPLIGWTPSGGSPRTQPYVCGFEVSLYGAQQSTDAQWDPNCGNGVEPNGATDITVNKPSDTSTSITTAFVTGWIDHLVGKFGPAANGGVTYYELDNEPMLWNSTHRDVHPNPTTYDEIGTATHQYAAAVKSADPTALTIGPSVWGWCGYLYSALDGCSPGADYASHNNTYLIPWYLQQMSGYQRANGLRLLDYLDVHFYPAGTGVSASNAGDSATQALRLRSTRALWDPAYIDESWISTTAPGGVAIMLIPRLQAWVAANYPGTRISISEYNFGALSDINGALAQADALGIFGSQGLDMATLWGPTADTDPFVFAFLMYRNYDAAHHAFGDVSTQATSADPGTLAVYAAQRTDDNALTVMVINKVANPVTSSLTLAGYTPAPTAEVYQYSPADVTAIQHLPSLAVSSAGFTTTFPGNSITLVVLTSAGSQPGGLWQNATSLENGWEWLSWFGYFYTGYSPWIYHSTLGWLYPFGTSTESIWFYDPAMDGGSFWWTSATVYPYVYRASDGAWLYYSVPARGQSSTPRWFYDFNVEKWEND